MTSRQSEPAESPPHSLANHALQCMEVWGGNVAAENGVSAHGVDAWITSIPYRGEPSGGDIHYVSMCGEGRIARFVLADVAGHGTTVSDLAGTLRSLMRKHIGTPDQARFARSLNRAFGRLSRDGIFATAALATYFAPTNQLIACLAGHPRPLWYHAGSRSWTLLSHESSPSDSSVRNLPLGIIHPTEYRQFAVTLELGDLVVLYTDGVTEQGGPGSKKLSDGQLLEMARTVDAADHPTLGSSLLAASDVMLGRRAELRDDDATVLVLHHNGASPPQVSLGHRLRMMGKMLGL